MQTHGQPARAMLWMRILSLFAAATLASPPTPTHADDRISATNERWLFVPVLSGPLPRDVSVNQLSGAFEVELRASGHSVLSNQDAASLFETRHSSEPLKLAGDELQRALRSISQAARHLALGEIAPAQQSMESVYALSGPARDFLNREPARARNIFDTCVMTAYLWERDHQRPQALRQMLECARTFPGMRPEGRAYPPELRDVFEQARQQLAQLPSTALQVRSAQAAACGVRLNGIEIGKSPLTFSEIRPGIARVQLECAATVAGRVHSVEVRAGDNRVDIDPAFDTAVHSRGALWLQYDSDTERDRRADSDVAAIQQAVGVNRVVALLVEGSTYPRVHVRPLFPVPHEIASMSYSAGEGYSSEAVVAALKIVRPPPPAFAPPPPTAAAVDASGASGVSDAGRAPAQPARVPQTPHQQQLAAGVIVAAIGAGGLAASWVYFVKRQSVRTDQHTEELLYKDSETYFQGARWSIGLGIAGALVMSIADYLWVPDAPSVPAWAWVVGSIGAATGLTALGLGLLDTHCALIITQQPQTPFPGCQRATADSLFAPLLALSVTPLIAIPLAYAFRIAARPSDDAQVRLHIMPLATHGAALVLHGAF